MMVQWHLLQMVAACRSVRQQLLSADCCQLHAPPRVPSLSVSCTVPDVLGPPGQVPALCPCCPAAHSSLLAGSHLTLCWAAVAGCDAAFLPTQH